MGIRTRRVSSRLLPLSQPSHCLYSSNALRNRLVAQRQNLRREHAGVRRAGLADRYRRDRHAGRHLNGRQQRVEPVQCGRVDWNADDRLRHVRRDDTAEVRGGAGTDDEDAHAARAGLGQQPHDALRRAVRRGDGHLDGDAELLQHIDSALHDRGIVLGTHENENL